jgi:tRNA (guanine-N7-)-methyltransferase
MTQRIIEITSPLFVPEERIPAGGLARLFPGGRPLALEIGCGIGDFIVQLAAQRPEVDFIATDIYNKGCLKTCRRLEKAGLANVRVVRLEARYLLTRHLERESLSALYINCPDPWPKKRHRSRRLVNADFLRLALYFLRPGGEFYFCTDFADYAEQVTELLPAAEGFQNCLPAPFALELPGYPVSKYMRRFLDRGEPIHFVHGHKREECRADESLLPPIRPDFRLAWSLAGNG